MTEEAGGFLPIHRFLVITPNVLRHLKHRQAVIFRRLFPAGEIARVMAMRTTHTQALTHVIHRVLVILNRIQRDIQITGNQKYIQIVQR